MSRDFKPRPRTHKQRLFLVAGVGLAVSLMFAPGCGWTPVGDQASPGRPPLPSSIVEEGELDDPLIQPSGLDEPSDTLWITAAPVFCCDSLAVDFTAEFDPQPPYGTVFEWDFGDGATARGQSVEHTFPWPGVFDIRLTASLRDGTTRQEELAFQVGDPAEPPTEEDTSLSPASTDDDTDAEDTGPPTVTVLADAGPDHGSRSGEIVTLDGSMSTGSGVGLLMFEWRQISGPAAALHNPTQPVTTLVTPEAVEEPLLLVFEVSVTQGTISATDRVRVTVSPTTSTRVTANAGADLHTVEGSVVLLDGTNSRATDPGVLTFAWQQTSGPLVELTSPNASTTTFVARSVGAEMTVLTFEVTVTLGDSSNTDSTTITVTPLPGAPSIPDRDQILAWLRDLEPLNKVHYSWPIPLDLLTEPVDPLLYEYARLTHAVTVRENVKEEYLQAAAAACQQVNDLGESPPASIAIVYLPWYRVFPPDSPPTYTGPEHDEEIALFRRRVKFIRDTLAAINARRGSDIRITALLFDTERFIIKTPDQEGYQVWNDAITAKYDAIYYIARDLLPNARVEWYGRGIQRTAGEEGWSPFPWFTFEEQGDSFSCALYRVPEIGYMRETFRETYEFAQSHGTESVTPWVALAAGYRRRAHTYNEWVFDWDFDVVYSYLLGAELNHPWYGDHPDRFAPWNAAEVVVFYPTPFSPATPAWAKHFVAYVNGANGTGSLPME